MKEEDVVIFSIGGILGLTDLIYGVVSNSAIAGITGLLLLGMSVYGFLRIRKIGSSQKTSKVQN